ncbi:manganese superoxide dismutase [Phaffia rhodozyma]|uniref:Superoxide dismutase n=1 Tax=Phaffia rhodozyma TaxID=264483 RepID=A0A0F7SMT7_PHARH|nr:manganese superoxide dismutase [Phaffia rhodozyma]
MSVRASLSSVSRQTFVAPAAFQIRAKHTLPELPYAYDALEPSISKEIMTLHHTKHHQTYVNGLNAAEESYSAAVGKEDVLTQVKLQSALKFNGGGHINHSLFWKNLAPYGSEEATLSEGPLKKAIEESFGSFEAFKKKFNADTAAVQGSGWGWLGLNPLTKKLEVTTTANQDPLLTHIPIIGVDIWEHAFYLQYKNVKPDYLAAVWSVINYKEAEARLQAAL